MDASAAADAGSISGGSRTANLIRVLNVAPGDGALMLEHGDRLLTTHANEGTQNYDFRTLPYRMMPGA